MPFEAGLAYAIHASKRGRSRHDLLFLDAEPYRYQASISDLAGLDPASHGNDPTYAIDAVRTFFAQHHPTEEFISAGFIQRRYLTFSNLLKKRASADLTEKKLRSWALAIDLQRTMLKWIRAHP
jgi:hypothetical protein